MAQQIERPYKETMKTDETTGAVGFKDVQTPTAPQHTDRRGFLPIKTNRFDRIFISVVCYVAIHLLWMRFLEAYLSLWVATVLSLILAVIIIRRG
jgi:predicted small integral membrane protein